MYNAKRFFVNLLLLSGTLTACSKEPAVEYKLSADQLAWQGYTAGRELRFGHLQSPKVRTYLVTSVTDRMEKAYMGINWLPLPSKEPPRYQHITVMVQRTDTVAFPIVALELLLDYNPNDYSRPELRAVAEWGTFYYGSLPLNEVNRGVPIDSTVYAATLLPSVTLGPSSYSQVLRLHGRPLGQPAPGSRFIQRLYYARGKGVVAYEETGSGLWYRLP